jgi:hypothetical protein
MAKGYAYPVDQVAQDPVDVEGAEPSLSPAPDEFSSTPI